MDRLGHIKCIKHKFFNCAVLCALYLTEPIKKFWQLPRGNVLNIFQLIWYGWLDTQLTTASEVPCKWKKWKRLRYCFISSVECR